jgi:hypothetical protein
MRELEDFLRKQREAELVAASSMSLATMTEIRRADPATRRRAVVLVVVSALVGALLIGRFQHDRTPLLRAG